MLEGSARNEGAAGKPANQWSRQELDLLFARRAVAAHADAPARPPDTSSNPETGE
jgi:hypothetical protein